MRKTKDKTIQYVTYQYKNIEEYDSHKEIMRKNGFKAITTFFLNGDKCETEYEKTH